MKKITIEKTAENEDLGEERKRAKDYPEEFYSDLERAVESIASRYNDETRAAAWRMFAILFRHRMVFDEDGAVNEEGTTFACLNCGGTTMWYSETVYRDWDTLHDEDETVDSDNYEENRECVHCSPGEELPVIITALDLRTETSEFEQAIDELKAVATSVPHGVAKEAIYLLNRALDKTIGDGKWSLW